MSISSIYKKIFFLAAALAAMTLLLPAPSQAAQFEIYGWNTSYSIKAVAPGADGTGARDINSVGGEFYVSIQGLGQGVAYCIDPWQTVGGGEHNYSWFGNPQDAGTDSPPGNTTILTSLGGLEAAYLIRHFSQVFTGNDDPAGIGTKAERTALQMAIWEVVFDVDGGFDVTTGAFHLADGHGLSQDIVNRANFMLSTLPTFGGGDFTSQMLANLNDYFRVGGQVYPAKQDLIGGVATPEPGTMLLLGSALLGGGILRRRRKKADA